VGVSASVNATRHSHTTLLRGADESFFVTLRAELVDHERFSTADAAERSIGD